MSTFQEGDLVEITGKAYGGDKSLIGQIRTIESIDPITKFACIESLLFCSPCLRLLPGFKAGDRVRTTQDSRPSWNRGVEGVVVGPWPSKTAHYPSLEVRLDDVEDTVRYEADELELLPEPQRVPKVGEVWRTSDLICLVIKGGDLVNLDTGRLIGSAPYLASLRHIIFAAASVKDAAALGLL